MARYTVDPLIAVRSLPCGPGARTPEGQRGLMKRSMTEHQRLARRLKRFEVQVTAFRRIVESEEPCTKVLVQRSAAQGALGEVGQVMLRDPAEHCVADAVPPGTGAGRGARVEALAVRMGRVSVLGGAS